MSQLSVDTAHHVITDIRAYHADKKDSQYLEDITTRLKKRLHKQGLIWRNCIADTGYSSGENYAFLEAEGLEITGLTKEVLKGLLTMNKKTIG